MQNHPVHSASTESEVTAKADDGGPAFPTHGSMGEVATQGATLRDYFAAQAMGPVHNFRPMSLAQWFRWLCGMSYQSGTSNSDDIAREAYKRADAMLEARK